jgi:phosphoglycolate phosphatase-like HAD superfamily hydrolase
MKPRILCSAVVFDFDGVLVDSVPIKGEAFSEIYRPYGEDAARLAADFHFAHGGLSRFDKFRRLHQCLFGTSHLSQAELQELDRAFSAIVVDKVVGAPWMDGAIEILAELSESVPVFLASATPEPELKEVVKRRKANHYFREILGSPTAKAENLRIILERSRLSPDSIVLVGDSKSDEDAATEAGCNFVGYLNPHFTHFRPQTVTIRRLLELRNVITWGQLRNS